MPFYRQGRTERCLGSSSAKRRRRFNIDDLGSGTQGINWEARAVSILSAVRKAMSFPAVLVLPWWQPVKNSAGSSQGFNVCWHWECSRRPGARNREHSPSQDGMLLTEWGVLHIHWELWRFPDGDRGGPGASCGKVVSWQRGPGLWGQPLPSTSLPPFDTTLPSSPSMHPSPCATTAPVASLPLDSYRDPWSTFVPHYLTCS